MISKKAYTEAYIALESLNLLEDLPSSLVEEMKKNIIPNYDFQINKDIPVKFQISDKDTLALLSYIYIKYFCDDQEEKDMLKKQIDDNDKMNAEKRSKEYELLLEKNADGNDKATNSQSEVATKMENEIVKIKKNNFFEKMLNFIRKIFKK